MLVIKINYLLREDALRHLWATFATQAKHGGVVALPPYCTLLYAEPGDNKIKRWRCCAQRPAKRRRTGPSFAYTAQTIHARIFAQRRHNAARLRS